MKKRWTGLAAALVPMVMLSQVALAATGFTTRVSPAGQTNATEPSVAVDRADGTVWVAWQASGRHVARSDDGGRTFVQTPINSVFGNDVGDVDIRVGGPTPCAVAASGCTPGTRRVYLTSLERLPAPLQTHLAFSDDRGASWTENNLAAVNPSLIDRPWLAVNFVNKPAEFYIRRDATTFPARPDEIRNAVLAAAPPPAAIPSWGA